jgi:hypothetical protein
VSRSAKAAKRCIYCLRDSSKSKTVAHALPEAILRNGPIMTHGLICDGCNNYSAQLEAVLVSHPAIAMPIQLLGLKGKKGKPRTKLGEFMRGAEDGATITFATTEPIITVDPDGVRRATIKSLPDPRFDMAKFSRALHLAAFNVAALNRGAEWALDPARDAVRAYVRKPRLASGGHLSKSLATRMFVA